MERKKGSIMEVSLAQGRYTVVERKSSWGVK